jgi:hypothetical protein
MNMWLHYIVNISKNMIVKVDVDFFCVCSTGVFELKGLALARQALCHLTHVPSSFCFFSYFSGSVSLFA